VEEKEREQYAILEKEKVGGNGAKTHFKGNIYHMPLQWSEMQKSFAIITGSPK